MHLFEPHVAQLVLPNHIVAGFPQPLSQLPEMGMALNALRHPGFSSSI